MEPSVKKQNIHDIKTSILSQADTKDKQILIESESSQKLVIDDSNNKMPENPVSNNNIKVVISINNLDECSNQKGNPNPN